MDPLIAVQVYNNRFCPFGRLPEELLLQILDVLDDDAVTLLLSPDCLEDIPFAFSTFNWIFGKTSGIFSTI